MIKPLAKVEEAEMEVMLRTLAFNPPAKVEVALTLFTCNWEVEAKVVTAKKEVVAWLMKTLAKEAVEEACKFPATCNGPAMVDEALEINPPARVDKLATLKVEEADNGPPTFKLAETVEEAEEINPLDMVSMVVEAVAREECPETVNAVRIPTLVKEEAATPEPKVLPERTAAPLIR